MNQFIQSVRVLWNRFISLISSGLGWVGNVFRRTQNTIIPSDRPDTARQRYQATRQRTVSWIDRYVDRDSRYFRIVVGLWRGFVWALVALAVYVFCVQTNFLYLTGEMPETEELQNPKLAQSSEIFTADGVPIGKFFTENRTPIKDFKQLSPNLVNALVATEDFRFYQHSGVDYKALAGVAVGILRGGERGGGSTITQQLAKNLFKTRKKLGIARKGLLGYVPGLKKLVIKSKEWLTAINLERTYTKEEIILMYLNTVDYGSNAYGIKVAAKTYFDTSTDSLNLQQAAVLVGLQKATTTYNPISNPDKSLKRRNTVLAQMAKYGYITPHVADSVAALPLLTNVNIEQPTAGSEGYFKKYIQEFLNNWAEEADEPLDLYRDGLRIVTTIDSRMQAHAENSVQRSMKQLQRQFENHWGNRNPWTDENGKELPDFIDTVAKRTDHFRVLSRRFPNQPDSVWHYIKNVKDTMKLFSWRGDKKREENFITRVMTPYDSISYYKKLLQAGMMSMEPTTGHIKAWVGGLDYDFFKYDHVRQAKRQPGSTFKPIVYCAAIDGPRNLSPCDRRRDEPFSIGYEEGGKKRMWNPKNADGRFTYANMTLRQAMARSVNSVTARLTDEVRPDTVIQYARKLGISTPLQAVPSIGLGSFDVSLYEMVAAYATFLNKGNYTEPLLVLRIEDRNGNVIKAFQAEQKPAIREESAFLMRYMLQGGLQENGGTSSRLLWDFKGLPGGSDRYNLFGGKTGTTSNYSDGWYMGVTRDLVTGVWVGGDDRSIHFRGKVGEGAQTALPIYKQFMEEVFADKSLSYKPNPFPSPKEMGLTLVKQYQCSPAYIPRAETFDEAGEVGDSLIYEPPIDPTTPADTSGLNQ
ncbi:MAG: transglycosylase domain-containing protein [Cytophagaceae bacterium]|nr:transglycosylase domain-containing protein [Cytophagaceae bacterium]